MNRSVYKMLMYKNKLNIKLQHSLILKNNNNNNKISIIHGHKTFEKTGTFYYCDIKHKLREIITVKE